MRTPPHAPPPTHARRSLTPICLRRTPEVDALCAKNKNGARLVDLLQPLFPLRQRGGTQSDFVVCCTSASIFPITRPHPPPPTPSSHAVTIRTVSDTIVDLNDVRLRFRQASDLDYGHSTLPPSLIPQTHDYLQVGVREERVVQRYRSKC